MYLTPEQTDALKALGFDLDLKQSHYQIQTKQIFTCVALDFIEANYRIVLTPTFSQFSRTYGFKIYHIVDGVTEEISHRYEKHQTKFEAESKGLDVILKMTQLS